MLCVFEAVCDQKNKQGTIETRSGPYDSRHRAEEIILEKLKLFATSGHNREDGYWWGRLSGSGEMDNIHILYVAGHEGSAPLPPIPGGYEKP
jgi:hypothetical protein